MKILHTADWHLGKRLEQFSRLPEQVEVMEEICTVADAQDVDVVIVAGDLFDTFNPSSEAVDLFYKTLKRLSNHGKRLVVAIAGNHDSPERIEAPDPLARECGIVFAGFPYTHIPEFKLESGIEIVRSEPGFIEVKLSKHDFPLRLILTPYANEFRMKTYLSSEDTEAEMRQLLQDHWTLLADKYCDPSGVNVLVSHLYLMQKGGIPIEEPEEEKSIVHVGGAQVVYTENIPSQVQYTALGHLHRSHFVGSGENPVVYSGSPVSYSFGEANQQKYVMVLDVFPGQAVTVNKIPLVKGKKLLRYRAQGVADALQWLADNQNTLVEITIVTDTYLTAQDRKNLTQAHDGIVTILPEVKLSGNETNSKKSIDLNESIETLFGQYFESKKGIAPNQDILDLFREITAKTKES